MSEKPILPDNLRALALAAKGRVQKLGATAPLDDITPSSTGGYMESPYAEEDWELWACLLLDTFGTRNLSVAHAFMRQLGSMIPKEWDAESQRQIIDAELFQLALSIICSLRPRNEAEAAIAVHCVALHLATYKIADHIGSRSILDPRTGAALAAITKAYAAQVLVLQQMRTSARAKRQVIKVQKNVTVNYAVDARQVHLPGGGSGDCDGQPYAPTRLRAHATPQPLAALPSQNAQRALVSRSSGEGETGLPTPRRGQGIGSTEG